MYTQSICGRVLRKEAGDLSVAYARTSIYLRSKKAERSLRGRLDRHRTLCLLRMRSGNRILEQLAARLPGVGALL